MDFRSSCNRPPFVIQHDRHFRRFFDCGCRRGCAGAHRIQVYGVGRVRVRTFDRGTALRKMTVETMH